MRSRASLRHEGLVEGVVDGRNMNSWREADVIVEEAGELLNAPLIPVSSLASFWQPVAATGGESLER
jgi:hypothetical protein